MKVERVSDNKFVVVLKKGEKVIESLLRFAGENEIKTAFISGIGAVENTELGYYDSKTKEYKFRMIKGSMELLSIIGNITIKEDKPFVHCHIVLGKDNVTGGHLKEAETAVTAELLITVSEEELIRKENKELKIWLID